MKCIAIINFLLLMNVSVFYTHKTQFHEVRQATVVCHITNTEIYCCL